MNVLASLDSFRRDLSYGVRALRRNPLFTAIAVVTLAIGSGANTAVFSVVDSVLLNPLPYPQADDLVAVRLTTPGAPGVQSVTGTLGISASMFFTFAGENSTFEHVGIWRMNRASVTGVAEPEEIRAATVSEGVLEALGVQPALGRWLSAEDQTPGGARTALLTYEYWQRRFGGDAAVLERTIRVNEIETQIVGVMPAGFRIAEAETDLIAPFQFDRSRLFLQTFDFRGIARLKPGRTIEQADADIARMLPIWLDSWPPLGGGNARAYEALQITPASRPLKDDVVGNVGDVLWIVMGTIGVVLLIACANVTNLILVRADGRREELAVRAALGAGSWRIGRQLLAESVLLGSLGGLFGVALAFAALEVLVAVGPAALPRLHEIALDWRALAFALVVSLLSGFLLGLIPAMKYAGGRLSSALHASGRGLSASRGRHRTQNVLVVAQVALALVLLVSSGLMVRSFQALRSVEPGFTDAAELQTFRISIPPSLVPDADRVARMQNDILDALGTIPGVTSAGFSSSMPLEGFDLMANAITIEDQPTTPGDAPRPFHRFKFVSPDLIGTAGTRLVAGRDIGWADVYSDRPVVMVSENLARELWGTPAAALGKRIGQGPDLPWREVIGVVEDVRDNGLHVAPPAIVYWPPRVREFSPIARDFVMRQVTFVVRTERAGLESLLREIQQAVWSVNASAAVASVRTMQDVYDRSLARTTFTLLMLGTAGAMALVLGIVGLYGVISYAVSQRRREIAIRSALGEQRPALISRFVRHGVVLGGIGVAFGLGAASGVTRLMTSLLYAVEPLDLVTYVAVALALTAAAAVASYVPARRAAHVDPIRALRED